MSIINVCPPILIPFNKNLLYTPMFGYNAEYLHEIGKFLKKKLDANEFKKFPNTRKLLENKYKHFMELYERAKTQERENKGKTCVKTQWLGYRPRLDNRNDQRLFERLNDRAETSKRDRRSG